MINSPIAKYLEIIDTLKALQGIKSVQRDVGQIEYAEETASPIMPCVLLKNEGTEWEYPTHEGNQSGSTVFKITLLTSLASVQNLDLSKNLDLAHEILFETVHEKMLKIRNLKRFSNQEHTIVQFQGGLSLITSAKYRSEVYFENTEFYQIRTLGSLNHPSINAQINQQFP
jgi:hypothetical protein